MRGEKRSRSCQTPSENDVQVERVERTRRPADEQQECDDYKPVDQNIARERPEAGARRDGSGKGQREHDERKDEVGTLDRLAERESANQKSPDRHKEVERQLYLCGRRELMVEETSFGMVCGEDCDVWDR